MELVEVKKQPIKYKTNAGDEIDVMTDCFTIMTSPKTADMAVKKIQNRIRIPGFRQGKAPRKVIENQIGKDNLYMDFLTEAWAEFVATNNVLVATTNEISNINVCLDGSVSFSVMTTTIPPVTLTLKDQYEVDITKSVMNRVAQSLQTLRNKYTSIETVTDTTKALQWGEVARFSYQGFAENSETPDDDLCGTDIRVLVGNRSIVIPEIEEALVDMKVEETKTITCQLPTDLAQKLPKNPRAHLVAGKNVKFVITLHEIQVRKFASDEEIAVKEGKETFKDLYMSFVNDEVAKTEKAPKSEIDNLLKQIITDNETVLSSVVTPVVLDHRLNSFLNRYNQQLVAMNDEERNKIVQNTTEQLVKGVYQDIALTSLVNQLGEQLGDPSHEEVKTYMTENAQHVHSYWQAYQHVQHDKLLNMLAEKCAVKFDTENESFKSVVNTMPATNKPLEEIAETMSAEATTEVATEVTGSNA